MYAITTEPARTLARVKLSGFLTVGDVAAFADEVVSAIVAMGFDESGGHLLYVDTRDCVLQSQEVVGAFRQMIASTRYPARRIAIVTGNSISRMQARRVVVREGVRVFECDVEANSWLLAARHVPAAPVARLYSSAF